LPKVSIILPTHNGAKYIRKSIESCLNQTYKNIELIIVDDGSTDETPEIIRSFKDERIKHFRHKKNAGLPNALNTGFANSHGEYLTWTSDDNYYLATAIEELLAFLRKNSDVDFVYADYWVHYFETGYEELRRLPDPNNLAKENCVGACFLYTRRVYEAVGNYDPRYRLVEDYDYWIRIFNRFKTKHYLKPLYVYGEHPESLKSTGNINISYFEAILKYNNGYISFSELARSFQLYIRSSIRKVSHRPIELFDVFQNIAKVMQFSFSLFIICFALMIRFSVIDAVSITTNSLLVRPLEYIDFYLLFKPKISRLKASEDRTNILCIIPSLVVGGAEKVILNIARSADKQKFTFHLMAAFPSKGTWRSNYETYFENVVTSFDKIGIISNIGKNYGYFQYLIEKLHANVLLITNVPFVYSYIPLLKADFRDLRIVDLIHSRMWPPIRMLKASAPYVDRRVCISHDLRNHLIREYRRSGVDKELINRIEVIHNGVDSNEFNVDSMKKGAFKAQYSIPENAKVVTFVGRFSEEKNPLLFVEIAKNLLKCGNHDLKFVMAGDGPELVKVKKMIKGSELEDHFVLTGEIDNIPELLRDTYILWVVSKQEGIPLVILEAMSMGVPVLSTNVGEISEAIKDEENSFLIQLNLNTVESFVYKTLSLLEGKTNYSEVSRKAREAIASKFDLKIMGSNYDEVLGSLNQVPNSKFINECEDIKQNKLA
jgi:glycosyltransferase involved in cell wall biosynthesis